MNAAACAGRVLVAAFLGCAWSAVAAAEDSVDLTPCWAPGEPMYVELVDKIESKSRGGPGGGEETTRASERIRGVVRRIEAIASPKGTRMTLTFDRMKHYSEGRRGPMTFDSDADKLDDSSNVLAGIFGPMIGMSLTMDVDSSGRITAFKGMEAVYEKIEPTATGNFVFAGLQDDFTDESARVLWGDSRMVLYPYKTVKVGDTWTRTVRQFGVYLGDVVREYQCTLDRIGTEDGRPIAVVRYTAKIAQPPGAKRGARMFFMLLDRTSGDIEGTATFDVKKGEFVAQSETTRMIIDGSTSGPGPDETKPVHMETTTRQTLTLMTDADRKAQRAENRKAAAEKDAAKPAVPKED